MGDVSKSDTPLKATFNVRLNGETVTLATVGQAYSFISNLSAVEWMEFRSLHDEALVALERAAGNAMLTVQATNALRMLFVRAKLL
ncbi:delta-aminolevulinic acid dehydratase/porphobilinogen synthase [Bradyrhizobium sp. USDA 4503]